MKRNPIVWKSGSGSTSRSSKTRSQWDGDCESANRRISGGRADNRPGLQAALADACKRRGVLVVYSLSRVARSTRDALAIAERLDKAGADLVCIETMVDLREAVLAVRAARAVAPALPVLATMTFERTRRGFFTVMGAPVEQAARELGEAGADILGSNCGNGSEVMVEIAREFRAHTARPIAIQPNAGLPETRGGETVYPETPEFMAEQARALVRAGVSIVGGCCGTTPEHIRALRAAVG